MSLLILFGQRGAREQVIASTPVRLFVGAETNKKDFRAERATTINKNKNTVFTRKRD